LGFWGFGDIEDCAGSNQFTKLHNSDSRMDDAGRPDLVLASFYRGRYIVAEVKKEGGTTSAAQRVQLDFSCMAGIETYLWYPRHWDEVREILNARHTPDWSALESAWKPRTLEEHEADIVQAHIDKMARRAKSRARRG
jgi:hypothetical protein